MHNLKLATIDDIDLILPLCRNFFESSPFKVLNYDEIRTRNCLSFILSGTRDKGIVIVDNLYNGMIIGAVGPPLFSSDIVASEIAWWVNPTNRKSRLGISLIQAYSYWAENVAKAKFISLSNLQDERLHKLYTKLGFTLLEQSYLKVLN